MESSYDEGNDSRMLASIASPGSDYGAESMESELEVEGSELDNTLQEEGDRSLLATESI